MDFNQQCSDKEDCSCLQGDKLAQQENGTASHYDKVQKESPPELEEFRKEWRMEIAAAYVKKQVKDSKSYSLQKYHEQPTKVKSDYKRLAKVSSSASVGSQYSSAVTSSFCDDTSLEDFKPAVRFDVDNIEGKEDRAKALYLQAAELERAGHLYQAVRLYKKSMQLVPDIESLTLYQSNANSSDSDSTVNSDCEDDLDVENNNSQESVRDINQPQPCLSANIHAQLSAMSADSDAVCFPEFPQQMTHIGSLPREVFEQILSWVVGGDLDMRSFAAVSCTCRGFFALSRADTLWRRACIRVWGCESSPSEYAASISLPLQQPNSSYYDNSWRWMYLTRPQPRYNGCYISRTSYFRFFPGGIAMMMTSTDEPQLIVGHLAHKLSKHPQVVHGRYCLDGSFILLEFNRSNSCKRVFAGSGRMRSSRRKAHRGTDVVQTTLRITMELSSSRRGDSCWLLYWRSYSISNLFYSGQLHNSPVDVSQLDTFPPLAFSRVKSYAKESTEPLL